MPFATSFQSQFQMNPAMALGNQDLLDVSTTAKLPLGTLIRLQDGRMFMYGQAGGTELAYAKLNQQAAPSANANNEVVATAAAVGDVSVGVTFGGAVTANQYQGGFLYVNDANGEGQLYTVKSHPAGTTNVIVKLNEAVRVAITTSGEVSLIAHPMAGLIVAPTTLTGAIMGVNLVTVPASNYAWFQVKGPCVVLTDGTLVIGENCIPSNGTAGAVEPSASDTLPVVGTVLSVNASTEYSLINLDIPGF